MILVVFAAVFVAAAAGLAFGPELVRFVFHSVSYPTRHREEIEEAGGWPYVEVKGPDGTIEVRTPGLDKLCALRHAHPEETDPQLERWTLGELDDMRVAIEAALEGDEW